MNATSSARIERRTRRMRRFVLIAIGVALGFGGCGGGGGSGGNPSGGSISSGGPAQPPPSKDPSSSTVTVTVKDVFGAPVRGHGVSLNFTYAVPSLENVQGIGGTTDRNGTVRISLTAAQAASEITAYAWDDSVVFALGSSPSVPLQGKGHADITITLRPSSEFATIGLGPTVVEADAIAADGRSLTFALRVIGIPSYFLDDGVSIALNACTPDAANDAPVFLADCVKGAAGLDAAYEADNSGEPLSVTTIRAEPTTFSAALLLDQSENMMAMDSTEARLFDTKYFLTTKRAPDRVALAAFASDATASSKLSPLPQQPVSIFPVENPQFSTSSSDLFPLIDSLEQLEGGVAPLYAAIDRMLDFTAANAPLSTRRAVVVVTGGQDDTCGSPAQCDNARQALIAKSRATGIAIVAIRLAPEWGPTNPHDNYALSELAEGSGGAMLWANGAYSALGIVFGALSSVLDGSANVSEARFRIRSSADGTFQSGRTVLGTVHFETCPWDCKEFDVPFAVRIP